MVHGTVADGGLLCAVAQKCLEQLSNEAAYLQGPSILVIILFLAFVCVLLHGISQTVLRKQCELCELSHHAKEIRRFAFLRLFWVLEDALIIDIKWCRLVRWLSDW
jgi:hypothetical protein